MASCWTTDRGPNDIKELHSQSVSDHCLTTGLVCVVQSITELAYHTGLVVVVIVVITVLYLVFCLLCVRL